nr:immunoglobulin light chain junction region [Mus musculus]NSL99106.1 immunoglobulin light chain junction region [Mus musculus]NSL99276.1 immunoglobulin light chain junction region [Mus musculus]NSM02045.1 immunoglobulin light chain junction region [Mus musculus]
CSQSTHVPPYTF